MTATTPPFISIHLPKSGGSSVRTSLAQQFGERLVVDYGFGPLGPRALEVRTEMPPGADIVHGHFRPGRYDAIPDAFRFTFLRHPVDLLLSFYLFWRDMAPHDQPLHDRFLAEKPPIETFARWPKIARFQSDTYFGGYDMNRIDFIGFHDTRKVDMERLNALAGLRLDSGLRENATPGGWSERIALVNDTARMADLADALIDDVRFYDRVRAQRA